MQRHRHDHLVVPKDVRTELWRQASERHLRLSWRLANSLGHASHCGQTDTAATSRPSRYSRRCCCLCSRCRQPLVVRQLQQYLLSRPSPAWIAGLPPHQRPVPPYVYIHADVHRNCYRKCGRDDKETQQMMILHAAPEATAARAAPGQFINALHRSAIYCAVQCSAIWDGRHFEREILLSRVH